MKLVIGTIDARGFVLAEQTKFLLAAKPEEFEMWIEEDE